jgi:Na+/H+-dicarboxylate symporter
MGPSTSDSKVPMHIQIVIALILGVGCGVLLGEDFVWIGVLGQIFVAFLKMVVVPLIFCSIVVAIASIGDSRLGQLGSKTIAFYLLTTGLAVLIGLLVANTIRPGDGADINPGQTVVAYEIDWNEDGNIDARQDVSAGSDRRLQVPADLSKKQDTNIVYWIIYGDGTRTKNTINISASQPGHSGGLDVSYDKSRNIAYLEPQLPKAKVNVDLEGPLETLMKAIPSNPLGSMAKGEILPTVVFAVLLALALVRLKTRSKIVVEGLAVICDAMMVIVNVLLKFTPIGVFALIAAMVSQSGIGVLTNLVWYCVAVVLGLTLQILVVYPILLITFSTVSPFEFFGGMKNAILFAFSTSSSSATLPVTMNCLEENLQVDKKVTNFVLPLGATVNMDGTALYEAMAAIFIAQAYGIDLSIGQQIVIFLTANLAAIGAAGIPGAGLVTMAMVLNAVGLPLEGLGIILAVDRILDMFRTATNVAGDGAVTLIVAESFQAGDELPETEKA